MASPFGCRSGHISAFAEATLPRDGQFPRQNYSLSSRSLLFFGSGTPRYRLVTRQPAEDRNKAYLADLLDSPSMDATASIRNGRQRSEITLICARTLCFFSGAMSDFGSAS